MWTSDVDAFSWPPSPGSCDEAPPTTRARSGGGVRPVKARTRRRLVKALRALANRGPTRRAARRRFDILLRDRVGPVRADLLEIAALLERAAQPDPGCVTELHRLLSDGCQSPLYNADVHPSELRATLYYVRSRLVATRPAQ